MAESVLLFIYRCIEMLNNGVGWAAWAGFHPLRPPLAGGDFLGGVSGWQISRPGRRGVTCSSSSLLEIALISPIACI